MELGAPFNPWRLFHGIFLPEALLSYPNLEPGAKLCYGRLSRYAGKAGECWPAASTLAQELAVSTSQTRRYLQGLEKAGFIRREPRPGGTNRYVFLWHRIFAFSSQGTPTESDQGGCADMRRGGAQICAPHSVEESHRRESSSAIDDEGGVAKETLVQLYEQHVGEEPTGPAIQGILGKLEEKGIELRGFAERIKRRLYGRKKRISPAWFVQEIDRMATGWNDKGMGATLAHQVRAHVWGYMQGERRERVAAPDGQIVQQCMEALEGHTVKELETLLRERFQAGHRPGMAGGPRSYAWFPKVIHNHFVGGDTVPTLTHSRA